MGMVPPQYNLVKAASKLDVPLGFENIIVKQGVDKPKSFQHGDQLLQYERGRAVSKQS